MKRLAYFLAIGLLFAACGEDETNGGAATDLQAPQNLTVAASGTSICIAWDKPADIDAYSVERTYDGIPVTLPNNPVADTIRNATLNVEHTITIKIVAPDGRKSTGATKKITLEGEVAQPEPIAFVTTYAGLDAINANADDDEKAAAQWFTGAHPGGAFVSTAAIAAGTVNLSDYKLLWIALDRTYDAPNDSVGELMRIPAELQATDVLSKITAYYKAGGNLLLTNHATRYVVNMGRISLVPGIKGWGPGANNPDTWGLNTVIGNVAGQIYDHSAHPIYAGIDTASLTYGHPIIPLIDAQYKEDHNSMWDCNAFGFAPAEGSNVIVAFETATGSTVLGTWQHVVDYCCAGVVEFKPQGDFKGRCIAIGVAAYEWNADGNTYRVNIEKLTENAIGYLAK